MTTKKALFIPSDLNDPRFRQYIINILRRATYRQWKPRSDALKAARITRGRYKCALCGREDVERSELQLDHKIPVIDERGMMGMTIEEIIVRMMPQLDGWQVICTTCHKIKSDSENQGRKEYKKKKLSRKLSRK